MILMPNFKDLAKRNYLSFLISSTEPIIGEKKELEEEFLFCSLGDKKVNCVL